MTIDITRPGTPDTVISSPEIDEGTVFQKELMGMDKITARFKLNSHVTILLDDFIVYDGRNYHVRDPSEFKKLNANSFEYTVVFYDDAYRMYDKMIMHEDRTKFSYTGTPLDLLTLIVDNMEEFDVAWDVGNAELITEPITFTFDEQSCRTALTQVAEAFGLEYYIDDKDIYLIKEVGSTQTMTFRYGEGSGLYSLSRRSVDQAFSTRWYGYGGTHNLDSSYRSALGRLSFENSPIDKNAGTYGVKEGSITFSEIFPRFNSTVDTIPDEFTITDTDIDFDLNDQFIGEGGAKIVFKSGDLAGNEFIITKYDHATKKVTFGIITGDTGYILPNATVKAVIGDEYTFVGIIMPQTYVDNAESELEAAVTEHVEKNSSPKVAYDLEINKKYIRNNSLEDSILSGDRLTIEDADLQVNEAIRIQSVEWPLVNTAKIRAVISEDQLYSVQERMAKDVKLNEKATGDAQAATLYARQVADEIRNNALISQFIKTLVGNLSVLSGAFVAGNLVAGGQAGINGAGTADTEVRFWAGSSYDDRATAPVRILQDGTIIFTNLNSLDGAKLLIEEGIGAGSIIWDTDDEEYSGGVNPSDEANRGGVNPIDWILGSLFGAVMDKPEANLYPDDDPPHSPANSGNSQPDVRAGVIGMRASEWLYDTGVAIWGKHADAQLKYCKGSYGGLFSSIKNTGAEFEAMLETTDDTIHERNRNFIITGGGATKTLPERPDHGCVITIKNHTAVTKTISRGGSTDKIINLAATAELTTTTILAYKYSTFKFNGSNRRWYIMDT